MEMGKWSTHLQEELEGLSRELKACQPNLGTRDGYGADHPSAILQHVQNNQGSGPDSMVLQKAGPA